MVPGARHGHEGLLLPQDDHEDDPVNHADGQRLDLVGRVLGLVHVFVHEGVPRTINISASNKHE